MNYNQLCNGTTRNYETELWLKQKRKERKSPIGNLINHFKSLQFKSGKVVLKEESCDANMPIKSIKN